MNRYILYTYTVRNYRYTNGERYPYLVDLIIKYKFEKILSVKTTYRKYSIMKYQIEKKFNFLPLKDSILIPKEHADDVFKYILGEIRKLHRNEEEYYKKYCEVMKDESNICRSRMLGA